MDYVVQIMSNIPKDNVNERLFAIEKLSKSDQPEAVLELTIAILDPSTRVREAAVDGLGSMPAGRVCDQIIPLLASDDADLRNYIIEVLELLGAEAEKQLISATKSSDQDVRKFALDLIIKIGKKNGSHSEEAIQAILTCFNDANVNVVGSAIEALGYTKNKDYLPLVTKILKSESPWMQVAAISSIVRLTGSDAKNYFASIECSNLSEEAQVFLNALIPSGGEE